MEVNMTSLLIGVILLASYIGIWWIGYSMGSKKSEKKDKK